MSANASDVIIHADDEFYYAVTKYHVIVIDDYETYTVKVRDYLNNGYDVISLVYTKLLEIASESYHLWFIRLAKKLTSHL